MSISYSKLLAERALSIGAIRLQPHQPFTWASGYRMPVYNDNRLLLTEYETRAIVADGFAELIQAHGIEFDIVAGTATGGISPGTTLADKLKKPFVYVRAQAKGHGMGKQVEGRVSSGDLVLVIEDLVSTGKSSLQAVSALREVGAKVDFCLSIFSYGFPEAGSSFSEANCKSIPLFTLDDLIQVSQEKQFITSEEEKLLNDWKNDPFSWGEKCGFPRVQGVV